MSDIREPAIAVITAVGTATQISTSTGFDDMAEIKLYVESGRIFFIENEDRNGPALSVAMADKQALRQAINRMNNDGDEEVMTGEFSRIERHATAPVALFTSEADADAYVAAVGSGVQKATQVSVDGFDFKVVTV